MEACRDEASIKLDKTWVFSKICPNIFPVRTVNLNQVQIVDKVVETPGCQRIICRPKSLS